MCEKLALRAFVQERLTAAAEDIFALFERTIAHLEEELCRSKEENQRKQELLESVLSPRVVLLRADHVQTPSLSPGPGLNKEISETSQIKEESEEQNVKQEEEQLPMCVPESSAVCVKTVESSLSQQTQTEYKEETQGEDVSAETLLHSETEGDTEPSSDNDEYWRAPFSCSDAQMETEADEDVQIRARSSTAQNSGLSPKYTSAPETSVNNGEMSGTAKKPEDKKHQRSICTKRFGSKQVLQKHIRTHAGEKPYSCSTCPRTFSTKSQLNVHIRTHTGEKPYSCPTCPKTFADKGTLTAHVKTHAAGKPYSCPTCPKTFSHKGNLTVHIRRHTGEKPYSCPTCPRTFSTKAQLDVHIRTHTGEKPYSCPTCPRTFSYKSHLNVHIRTHTGEKPYSCPTCPKTFSYKDSLVIHIRTHTGEKPYSCPTCPRTFSHKHSLVLHIKTHWRKTLRDKPN